MGIYGAMNTAVSGMRAQSFALENISGNIANSQTAAYKRIDSSFADLVSGNNTVNRQVAGAVIAFSRATNTVQGSIEASSNPTSVAVNGDGYFVVKQRTGQIDNRSTFAGTDLYTRRGDFQLNREGYLVNGAGYVLMGMKVDPQTGNPVGSVPEVLQFENNFLPAQATKGITYKANLSSFPATTRARNNNMTHPNELLDSSIPAGADIAATNQALFMETSVSGGAITAYDSNGTPVNVQLRWAKTQSADPNVPGSEDRWNLYYLTDSNATGANPVWKNVGQNYVFNSAGQLNPAIPTVNLGTISVNNVQLSGVTMTHGTSGITQFDNANGDVQVINLSQDGMPSGQLLDIGVSDSGRITATYSNGREVDVAVIPLVSFNADDRLKRLDGGAFQASEDSGPAIFGANGQIIGSAIEASNTDIADEFSKLIVTQQAYSANSRVITTSNEMLRDVLNIVR